MALTQGFWVSASSFCFLGQCLNGLSLLSIASSLPTECQTEWGDEVILHLHQSWQFCNALIWICYKGLSLKVRSVTVGTRAGLNSLQLCVPNTRVTRDSTEYNTKIPKASIFLSCLQRRKPWWLEPWGLPVGQKGLHLPSQPSCGIFVSKDFQAEGDRASKMSSERAELPSVQREQRTGELGNSSKTIRCTRLVVLFGHSSTEWKVPGWLFCV